MLHPTYSTGCTIEGSVNELCSVSLSNPINFPTESECCLTKEMWTIRGVENNVSLVSYKRVRDIAIKQQCGQYSFQKLKQEV